MRRKLAKVVFCLIASGLFPLCNVALPKSSGLPDGAWLRSRFLKMCDLATAELNKPLSRFVDRRDSDPRTHHMPFFEDAHAVRALAAAYDMTRNQKYMHACRRWSDRIIGYQERMIPRGAYYTNSGRAPGETSGEWHVADSGTIAMAVSATAVRCTRPEDRKRYLDSVRAFADLVIAKYVGPHGGITNGFWRAHKDEWWCSTATAGSAMYLLHEATGEESYLRCAEGAFRWLMQQDFRKVRPITFKQRPFGVIFYCFELYATGLKNLPRGSPERRRAESQIRGALQWVYKHVETPPAARAPFVEHRTDRAGLPYLVFAFARQMTLDPDWVAAAERELRRIDEWLFGKRDPNVSNLIVWEVLSWGMLSYAERLRPGALFYTGRCN